MSSMIEDINHLSREIGARPAGTEEERLAAMYIAENMQKRSALPFDIEDFEGAKGSKRVTNILYIISAILLFLSVLLPTVSFPALFICIVIAVIVVLEYMGKPIVSNFFRYGISQNVVSKYIPAYSSENAQTQRKRKVVFVSHYDSGRSVPESGDTFFKLAYFSNIAALFADCLIVVFLAIKAFAFQDATGAVTLVCVIIALLLAIVCVLPSLVDLYKSKLLYNEGANCNASGNAVLMEIAKQLGTGAYATDEDYNARETKTVVHGKKEAEDKGLVPDGAKLDYQVPEESKQAKAKKEKKDALEEKEQSLEDAKAAVAAFMAPRKPRAQFDDEGNVIDEGIMTSEEKADTVNITIDDASAQRSESEASTTTSIPAYKTETKSSGDVPDWFKSARSKAKKNDRENDEQKAEKRSKFAHTMDVMAERKEAEEQKKKAEEEKKRAKLRKQIEAANKAAEEEREKKLADKKEFYRSQNDAESTSGMPAVAEEKKEEKKEIKKEDLSLDESFKKNFVQDSGKNEAKKEDKKESKPEDSGQIDLSEMQQYAPLDDQDFISSNEMPQNEALKELPEVFTDEQNIEENPEYAKALQEDNKPADAKDDSVEKGKFGTGSFAAVSEAEGVAGATGTFSPVQEELVEEASRSGEIASKDDMVVADADDSVYNEGEFTEQGAFAGKGYVNMPDEKRKGLFGRFSKKDKGSGKHATEGDGFIDAPNNADDNIIDDTAWEGGAFANIGNKFKKNKAPEDDFVDDGAQDEFEANEVMDENFAEADPNAPITSEQNKINSMLDPVPDFDKQIQEFHNASINMEVWMVALGSEVDENAGIKAFLMEHAQELRGAIIIDIEGMGAGQLSLVNTEGLLRKSETSSRMKRYVRSAANKLGLTIPSVDLPWGESAAAYAGKLGYKTLRLVGMDGPKPAYYMSKDDVVENIDENILQSNVKYLLQLIQSI